MKYSQPKNISPPILYEQVYLSIKFYCDLQKDSYVHLFLYIHSKLQAIFYYSQKFALYCVTLVYSHME